MTSIAPHITAYLQDYLAIQRGASQHTRDSYALSFQLLFEFASEQKKVSPSELSLEQIDAPLVTAFLEYLETHRDNTASTRNVRLAAIKSFFHFLEYRLPAALEQLRRVLAIPFKKTDSKLVGFLDVEQMQPSWMHQSLVSGTGFAIVQCSTFPQPRDYGSPNSQGCASMS